MQHEGIYEYRLANSHAFVVSLTISRPISCSHELATDFSCLSQKVKLQKNLGAVWPISSLIDINRSQAQSKE